MDKNTVYLVLENGKVFCGQSFGATGEAVGEIAITTSMVGYLETLTDAAYCGQFVVQTFPSIGNYGVMSSDLQSKSPVLHAYIVREWCQEPSNFRCEGDLDTFLKENGVIGMYGIDTRALTRMIRAEGAMNAKITTDISDMDAVLSEIKAYSIQNPVERVTVKEPVVYEAQNEGVARVAAVDCGARKDQIEMLTARGCQVTLYPASVTAQEILDSKADGVFLTTGPGNPADNASLVAEIKKLADADVPMLGIGLGHQLLALAHGAKTEKMDYGHRGGSQPTVEVGTPRIHNTPQNNGYTVCEESLPANAVVIYRNLNDGIVEGLRYEDERSLSVQFYPTRDTLCVYDQFVDQMKGGDKVCR